MSLRLLVEAHGVEAEDGQTRVLLLAQHLDDAQLLAMQWNQVEESYTTYDCMMAEAHEDVWFWHGTVEELQNAPLGLAHVPHDTLEHAEAAALMRATKAAAAARYAGAAPDIVTLAIHDAICDGWDAVGDGWYALVFEDNTPIQIYLRRSHGGA